MELTIKLTTFNLIQKKIKEWINVVQSPGVVCVNKKSLRKFTEKNKNSINQYIEMKTFTSPTKCSVHPNTFIFRHISKKFCLLARPSGRRLIYFNIFFLFYF